MNNNIDERRKWPRIPEEISCPATFVLKGKKFTGYMVDFSTEGVGFRIYGLSEDLYLKNGKVLSYEINTRFGVTNCSGKTAWFNRDGNGFTWGIKFEQLPKDSNDPIFKLIELSRCKA